MRRTFVAKWGAPCSQVRPNIYIERKRERERDILPYQVAKLNAGRGEKAEPIGRSSLYRMMNLRKRPHRRERPPKRKVAQGSEDLEARHRPGDSCRSRESPIKGPKAATTRMAPTGNLREPSDQKEGSRPVRRNSTGNANATPVPGMIPFGVAKKPIRPLDLPMASSFFEVPTVESTENALIGNKLGATEEKRGPDKQWAKVDKYTDYAARGFGALNPAMGRGVYGVDPKMAPRWKSVCLERTMWDLGIRVPINIRLSSGMALVRWGSGGGKRGDRA